MTLSNHRTAAEGTQNLNTPQILHNGQEHPWMSVAPSPRKANQATTRPGRNEAIMPRATTIQTPLIHINMSLPWTHRTIHGASNTTETMALGSASNDIAHTNSREKSPRNLLVIVYHQIIELYQPSNSNYYHNWHTHSTVLQTNQLGKNRAQRHLRYILWWWCSKSNK